MKSKLQEYALKSALNSFILERFDGTIIEITASGWDWKRGKPGYPLFPPDPLPDTEPPADPRLRTEL